MEAEPGWLTNLVIVVGILATIITAVAQIMKAIREHPSRDDRHIATISDATDKITDSFSQLVADQNVAIREHRDEVAALRAELGATERKNDEIDKRNAELDKRNEALDRRNRQLEREINDLKVAFVEYQHGVDELVEQIRMLGHEPVWQPPTSRFA